MTDTPKYPVCQVYPESVPSDYVIWDDDTRRAVLEYLADMSHSFFCSTGPLAVDKKTGEQLPWHNDTVADADGYYWLITLPYFIQKYNWYLPQDFLEHVLEKRANGWKPTELIHDFALA